LTLTVPVFNNARNVIFLVSGKDKAESIRSIFTDPPSLDLPAGFIKTGNDRVRWFVDKEAASLLN
jgi:6-phosphogluconolactonase